MELLKCPMENSIKSSGRNHSKLGTWSYVAGLTARSKGRGTVATARPIAIPYSRNAVIYAISISTVKVGCGCKLSPSVDRGVIGGPDNSYSCIIAFVCSFIGYIRQSFSISEG
jgi:hypothetical protein